MNFLKGRSKTKKPDSNADRDTPTKTQRKASAAETAAFYAGTTRGRVLSGAKRKGSRPSSGVGGKQADTQNQLNLNAGDDTPRPITDTITKAQLVHELWGKRYVVQESQNPRYDALGDLKSAVVGANAISLLQHMQKEETKCDQDQTRDDFLVRALRTTAAEAIWEKLVGNGGPSGSTISGNSKKKSGSHGPQKHSWPFPKTATSEEERSGVLPLEPVVPQLHAVEVIGAGVENANGVYFYDGIFLGQPRWVRRSSTQGDASNTWLSRCWLRRKNPESGGWVIANTSSTSAPTSVVDEESAITKKELELYELPEEAAFGLLPVHWNTARHGTVLSQVNQQLTGSLAH